MDWLRNRQQNGRQNGWQIFKWDIQRYKKAIVVVTCYIVVMELCFGRICPMVLLTGLPCPGCGLTRAGWDLLSVQFAAAWQMNPVIYPIAVAILYAGICRYVCRCPVYGKNAIIISIGILLLAVYIIRMPMLFTTVYEKQSISDVVHFSTPMEYNPHNLLNFIYKLRK